MSGRGRPGREPTPAERKKVKEYIAQEASQRVIAAALQRSVPNLRKYFAAELGLEKKSPAAPEFKKTAQQQQDVALMAACGEPQARIAKAIGVTEDQLGKHFAEDLELGAAKYRLKTLQRLDTLANAGSLGATSRLAAMTAQASDAPQQASAAAPAVGKKAAAKAVAAEAVAAGNKFAPRVTPRLATSDGKAVK